MRTRALILAALTIAFAAPSADATAQGKPKIKIEKNKAAAKKRNITKGVDGIRNNMDPALQNLMTGPNSMVNVTNRAKDMSPAEREKYAKEWRAEQSRAFGLETDDGPGKPVMSLDELKSGVKRPKLIVSSEEERRGLLLDELRLHAAYDAKIDRLIELVEAKEGKKSPLYARAKGLAKLEAKRHARSKLRIRAAKLAEKPDIKAEAAPEKAAPADTKTDSAEASP